MGAAAVQFDLFGGPTAAAPPDPPPLAPVSSAVEGPSPGFIAWVRKIVPVWTKRARLLREGKPVPEKGADWRADVLEGVVERLALKAAGGDRIAALKLRLDACQPYEHPTAIGIVCHSGPIMAEVRAELEAAIAYAEAQG